MEFTKKAEILHALPRTCDGRWKLFSLVEIDQGVFKARVFLFSFNGEVSMEVGTQGR